MKNCEIKTFDEFLSEGWFEDKLREYKNKWDNYKEGADGRMLKKLARIHTKLLMTEQKAKQNMYRYGVVRLNYEKIKMDVLDAKRLVYKIKFRNSVSPELLDAIERLDDELDRLNKFAIDSLHNLMIDGNI